MKRQCDYVHKTGLRCVFDTEKQRMLCSVHFRELELDTNLTDGQLTRHLIMRFQGQRLIPHSAQTDPDYCMTPKDVTLRFLESVLRTVPCANNLEREHLQLSQLRQIQDQLMVAIMVRRDCLVVPPLDVVMIGTRDRAGNFLASVASFTGTLLLVKKRDGGALPQEEPIPEARTRMKDLMRRPNAPWKF